MSHLLPYLISSAAKCLAFTTTILESLIYRLNASISHLSARFPSQITHFQPNNTVIHIVLVVIIAALLYSMSHQKETLKMANRAFHLMEESDALRVTRIRQLEELLELQERRMRLREAAPPPYQAARPAATGAGQEVRVAVRQVGAEGGSSGRVVQQSGGSVGAEVSAGGQGTMDQGTQTES